MDDARASPAGWTVDRPFAGAASDQRGDVMPTGRMRVLGTTEMTEWMFTLSRSQQHDFHHLPQYHRVAEQRGEGLAQFFVYTEGEFLIALPLLLRPIDEPGADVWQDATSVYGYGGPIATHSDLPPAVIHGFQEALGEELLHRRVVTVFSRLHPLIRQDYLLDGLGECPRRGETISINLLSCGERQRAGYNKSCRTSLRKLRETGFVGLHDEAKRHLPEFVDIYLETMRRADAQNSYFFDESYFNLLTQELSDVSHLFVALKDGEVAAATLCTICDGIVQDHLGGTRDAFLHASPDRLVVDTERVWATEAGARVLHLGGGVGARHDSVFRYKAGFSNRRHTFRIWRWIIQPEIYEELSARTAVQNAANGLRASAPEYFPAYRCPTVSIPDASAETRSRRRA